MVTIFQPYLRLEISKALQHLHKSGAMPERVLTKFEEDKAVDSNTSSISRSKKNCVEKDSQRGVKRKIDDRVAHSKSEASTPKRKKGLLKGLLAGDSSGAIAHIKRAESVHRQSAKKLDLSSDWTARGDQPRAEQSNGTAKKDWKKKPSLREKAEELLKIRRKLPIWNHQHEVRQSLRMNDVMLLIGETGSGKSTQVPQFLLNEPWCTGCIAITQPRRVAATTLARRVADEMGTPLGAGSPSSKVGYSVRFDTSVSPSTRIKFLTEGMLLQEMLRDPQLKQYSAVVVDEVHERSVNVDLILGFLKNIVQNQSKRKQALKVVVMSATTDMESMTAFFEGGEQCSDEGDSVPPENGIASEAENTTSSLPEISHKTTVSTCTIPGRQYPVVTKYLPAPTTEFVEEALKIIVKLHTSKPLPGDILVFMTGQDTIEELASLLDDYALSMSPSLPQMEILPLFAALPTPAQQRVFAPSPRGKRKIILATNIAETSVTVPGVRYVIDCGKVKIKEFRNKLGMESLLAKPISKSSAIQRKGRAGRETAGECHRLYTESDYDSLKERTLPEILRCDLTDAILGMKARGIEDVVGFPWLDRPNGEAMLRALGQLLSLGALAGPDQSITEIGRQMARLPLTPQRARVLVEAAKSERDCLLDAIDIIACLDEDNIFLTLNDEERKEQAEEARRDVYRREGDHMTLLALVRGYEKEQSDRKGWCERRFVSHRALQNVMVSRYTRLNLRKRVS